MTTSDVDTDGQRPAPDGKRPWETPHIIASVLVARTQVTKTSPSPVDKTSGATKDGS